MPDFPAEGTVVLLSCKPPSHGAHLWRFRIGVLDTSVSCASTATVQSAVPSARNCRRQHHGLGPQSDTRVGEWWCGSN